MNNMKKYLRLILITFTFVLASCSADEPQVPTKDFTNYECVEVIFNDNVLLEHPNIQWWNKRYNLEDDYVYEWYKSYFIGSILTFRNSGEILFNSYMLESMYGVKQADNVTISFRRLDWDNHYTGKILMKSVGENIYDCEVTDSDIKVTFNVTLIFKKVTD